MLPCPICDASAGGGHAIGDTTVIICPQCGGYRLAGTAGAMLKLGTLRKPEPERFQEIVRSKRGTSDDYPVITPGDLS